MNERESTWDKRLQIKTAGRDDSNSDQYRYPYEPTPYCVLERLADSGFICNGDVVLDYGCGKGRVDFFLSPERGIVLNEINTIPGFTSISLYPQMMAKSGIPYPELISTLLETVTINLSKTENIICWFKLDTYHRYNSRCL